MYLKIITITRHMYPFENIIRITRHAGGREQSAKVIKQEGIGYKAANKEITGIFPIEPPTRA